MSNEIPPRPKPEDELSLLKQRAKKAREAAELTLAQSKRRMPIARVEVVDSRIHDRGEINAQLGEAAHDIIVAAQERQEAGRLAAREEIEARTPREPRRITPSDSTDFPRRAPATTAGVQVSTWRTEPLSVDPNDTNRPRRTDLSVSPQESDSREVPRPAPAQPRFSESAPRPADRASSLETVEGWRKMLQEITRSTDQNNRERAAQRYFSPDDGEGATSFDDIDDGFLDMDSRGERARQQSEEWLRELEEDSTAAAKKKDDLLTAEVQWDENDDDDEPTVVAADDSYEDQATQIVGGLRETSGPRDGHVLRQDLQRAQADIAAEVARRLQNQGEVPSPALIPPVQNAAVSQPGFFRRWGNRIGLLFGLAAAGGASVGMNEMMKGNTSVGIDTGDDSNNIALVERGDTADSADSADSGDTADSSVDSTDSTDTRAFESGDSATETSESGDTTVDSGDSNSLIDSRDSGDSADSSVDSTDSFDSGETASDSFTRGGTGEYRQGTADSADSSDSRDSSGDTGLESGNETGDSGDSFRDSQDSARGSIDSFQDTNGDTGFDSADSGDLTLDSTGLTDSADSGDSFRDTRGGTGIDSADTTLDSADSGVDSTDSTDTGSLDSADSSGSRDSFGGTGFDNDSADSSDTMFYGGGTGFTGTDSGDSQGMDSSDSFRDTGTDSRGDSGDSSISSETAHSGDSSDTADTGDTGMPGETAVDTTVQVQPENPPIPDLASIAEKNQQALRDAAAAQDLKDHRALTPYDKMSLAEKAAHDDARDGRYAGGNSYLDRSEFIQEGVSAKNVLRTQIENGEGVSQAMLRLGVPIENITQALDSVEVVVGDQINTLRNILIDASEAKGNQIGMNIQQNPDGTIRGVEFYSVAERDHILTGSEMAEFAHFDALSVTDADRQIHTLEDQLDDLKPGTELYYSPLVIRLAEDGGAVQVRHITDGENYYELTPDFLSALGVDFTKYDKSKKEFLHEVPEAPLTRRFFRGLAKKEGLTAIPR